MITYIPALKVHVKCSLVSAEKLAFSNSNAEVYRDGNIFTILIQEGLEYIDFLSAVRHEVGHVITFGWLDLGETIHNDHEVYQNLQDDLFCKIIKHFIKEF